ncbi:hypothetical protein M758_UG207100 [Ceratodon purpureus]|nr:hypothetical protein M758_UG207100 [Ceratodon purpureus]
MSAPLPSMSTPMSAAGRSCHSEPVPSSSLTSPPRPDLPACTTVAIASNSRQVPCAAQREAANATRRQHRQFEQVGYGEMRAAHAAGRPGRFPIPTTPSGEIIGQRTKWHRAVLAIAKRTLDWSIREHKKHPVSWKWSLDTFQRELDDMFSFTVPVRVDVLEEYVAGFISNDRIKWKKYWIESTRGKDKDCLDKAFAVLDKYWPSDVGRKESEIMKEKRARVGATLAGSSPYNNDSPHQKRTRHDDHSLKLPDFPNHIYDDTDQNTLSSPVSSATHQTNFELNTVHISTMYCLFVRAWTCPGSALLSMANTIMNSLQKVKYSNHHELRIRCDINFMLLFSQ